MSARFELTRGLDEKVAQMVAPEVTNVAKQVERLAKQYAPPVKKWQSMEDKNVRDSHREANQQMRPANLRFALKSRAWDMANLGALGTDFPLEPNDPTAGLPGDAAQWKRGGDRQGNGGILFGCRCQTVLLPTLISSRIKRQATQVVGSTVTVRVVSRAPNSDVSVFKAEYGDTYLTRNGFVRSNGTRYMRRAIRDAAAGMS